jgi:hypothetical protein
MSTKNRLSIIVTLFILTAFGAWNAINYYAAGLNQDTVVDMMDYGYTDDIKYIQKWRPGLIQTALLETVVYKRIECTTRTHEGRKQILTSDGLRRCQEFRYSEEERIIKEIQSPIILKLIEHNQPEMIKLLLSFGADPSVRNQQGENALILIKSKTVVDLLKGHDVTRDEITVSTQDISFYPSQKPELTAYIKIHFSQSP